MRFRYSDGKTLDVSISLITHQRGWAVIQFDSHTHVCERYEFTNHDLALHDFNGRLRTYIPLMGGDQHVH
jgi:hypothetical protein